MKTFNYLDYVISHGVAVITLNSPNRVNTMSVESVREWCDAITLANQDDTVGAIVITGTDKAFSAGADMKTLFLPKAMGAEPYDDADPYTGGVGLFSTDWTQLVRESKPIVVAFNGFAVGGGVTAFLAADVLVASDSASFHFSFVKVGIVPELCSTRYLPARVGFGRASELLLTGRTIDGREAYDIGLVDYLFPADKLLEETLKIARAIAANPAPMLKMTKQLLDNNYLEPDRAKVWRRESDALRQSFSMDEHKEIVRKFLQKD